MSSVFGILWLLIVALVQTTDCASTAAPDVTVEETDVTPAGPIATEETGVTAEETNVTPAGPVATEETGVTAAGPVATEESDVTAEETNVTPAGPVATEESDVTVKESDVTPAGPVATEESEVTVEETNVTPAAPVATEETNVTAEETNVTPARPVATEETNVTAEETNVTPAGPVATEESDVTAEETNVTPAGPEATEESEVTAEETNVTPAGPVATGESDVTAEETNVTPAGPEATEESDVTVPVTDTQTEATKRPPAPTPNNRPKASITCTIRITNRTYHIHLTDTKSKAYEELFNEMVAHFKMVFEAWFGARYLGVTEIFFREGSVVVDYTVEIQPKVDDTEESLAADVQSAVVMATQDTPGVIGNLELDESSLKVLSVSIGEEDSSDLSKMNIAFIVLGCICFITLAAMLTTCIFFKAKEYRKRKQLDRKLADDATSYTSSMSSRSGLRHDRMHWYQPPYISYYPKQKPFWYGRSQMRNLSSADYDGYDMYRQPYQEAVKEIPRLQRGEYKWRAT